MQLSAQLEMSVFHRTQLAGTYLLLIIIIITTTTTNVTLTKTYVNHDHYHYQIKTFKLKQACKLEAAIFRNYYRPTSDLRG